MPKIDVSGRHPSTVEISQWFDYEHLPSPTHLNAVDAARMDALEVSLASQSRAIRRLDARVEKTEQAMKSVESKNEGLAAQVAELKQKFESFLSANT